MNASAYPLGGGRLHAANPHEPEEELLVEPVLRRAGSEKHPRSSRAFSAASSVDTGTKTFGDAEVAVVLRDLVLEDEMVAPRVPRELADEAVVLVQVVLARA